MNKKYYISLNIDSLIKQVFIIWNTKDGWFYIKDLLRLNSKNNKCKIVVLPFNTKNTWTSRVQAKYKAFTSWEVKLTHHFDGRAHISGTGILSWYLEDWTPKGASIKSFPLSENNDWWPVFTFLVWGLKKNWRDGSREDIVLVPSKKNIHPNHIWKELNGYVVKWFYILKNSIIPNNPIPSQVIYHSPVEGDILVNIVQSPDDCLWVIGLSATFAHHGFIDKWFAVFGAPTKIYNKEFCDWLGIVYPFTWPDDGSINLDYNGG